MKLVISPRSATWVAVFAMFGLAACDQHHDAVRNTVAADPSAVVIGTTPAAPTGDPPGTTPVDSDATPAIGKSAERNAMPLPGQANDHSNLSTAPSQRAGTPTQGNPPK